MPRGGRQEAGRRIRERTLRTKRAVEGAASRERTSRRSPENCDARDDAVAAICFACLVFGNVELFYWISDPGPEGESTKLTRPKIAPPTYCPPSQREPYCHVFHGPTILYWVPNPERILHYTNTTNFNWYLPYGYRCTMWVPGKTSGCRAWYVTRVKSVVATTRPLIDILRQDSDYYDIKIPK
ncbi:hypothetical protein B296_00012443 [Ensete ventricosum]|uniref:Uncharacterized protein n=1 Tax=Ensete ventricosum TaxID=4639 RepID=A0A427A4J6_ENSVE|nr:hypothetical protein B296_00012443 [Ensete ventricosum]